MNATRFLAAVVVPVTPPTPNATPRISASPYKVPDPMIVPRRSPAVVTLSARTPPAFSSPVPETMPAPLPEQPARDLLPPHHHPQVPDLPPRNPPPADSPPPRNASLLPVCSAVDAEGDSSISVISKNADLSVPASSGISSSGGARVGRTWTGAAWTRMHMPAR